MVWKGFILKKLCRKNSTKVAVKRENQILSVKKNKSINQLRRREEAENGKGNHSLPCRQRASGGKAVSLSTFRGRQWSQGWRDVAGTCRSCTDSPSEAAQPRAKPIPSFARSVIWTLRGEGEGVRGVFTAGFCSGTMEATALRAVCLLRADCLTSTSKGQGFSRRVRDRRGLLCPGPGSLEGEACPGALPSLHC